MDDHPLLAIDGVHLERGQREILRGVDMTILPGQVYGLLGRNGSGKSTLAYTLMGCAGYAPSAGRVLFGGQDITHLSITERARLGLTLAWQDPAHFEGIKVEDYLRLGMQEPSRERIDEALTAVALSPHVYLKRTVNDALSGGEHKRIELAAEYAMRPRLAILMVKEGAGWRNRASPCATGPGPRWSAPPRGMLPSPAATWTASRSCATRQ